MSHRWTSRAVEEVLQEINGRRGRRPGELARRASRARSRWLDRLRLLDLLGRLSGAGSTTARASASRSGPTGTGGDSPGRPTGASSTTAPRRDPTARRGASGRSWCGGTSEARVDRATTCPTSPAPSRPTIGRARREGTTALPGDAPFIMQPDGLGWIWVVERPQGRPAARALRAARVAGRNRSTAADATRRPTKGAARQRVRATRRTTALPARAHHLPADRAPHRRRHVAHAVAPRRAAARALLRDLAGAGGARSASNGDWVTVTTPRGEHRGPGAGHAAHAAARRSRDAASTRSGCRSTGAAGARHGRRRQRPRRHLRGAERADHGGEGAACAASRRSSVNADLKLGIQVMPHHRLPHRLHALHRLQGVRGGVQGVERGARGRLRLAPACPTTTPAALGHSTWRHVKFVERPIADGPRRQRAEADVVGLLLRRLQALRARRAASRPAPPASIVRTEFGGVFIQPDVCNGCGYCVVACPFGVVDRRPERRARLQVHLLLRPAAGRLEPACAKACPTESILFGELDDLRDARERGRRTARAA